MLARLKRLEYKWLVVIVFILGMFMDVLDSTAVNVAIPRLQSDFHAPLSTVEWAITGYLLSLALFIPGSGFLSDRFGTKRTFLTAMAVFVLGSALCGQAHTIQQLIAFRFLQGIGGGMMTPVSTAMVSREFPGEERAKASALVSVPWILGPITGPVVGGYLVTYTTWRWIFYINLPVGIIGFILALTVLREHKEPYAQGRFDLPGMLTGGVGVALVLYALSEAANHSWTSPDIVGSAVAGLVLLLLFWQIELRTASPMLDLRLFQNRLFALGSALTVWSFASYGGFIFLLTLFLQDLQGRTPLQAGLIQAPSAFGSAVSLIFAARLYRRVGPRRILVAGYSAGALLLLPFGLVGVTTAALPIVLLVASRSLTTPFAGTAAQTIVYGPLDSSKQGPASSIYNTNRQVATSFGVALLATIQVSRYNSYLSQARAAAHVSHATQAMMNHAQASGFHDAFFLAAVLLFISAGISLFVNDRMTREAMMRRVQQVGADEERGLPEVPATVSAD